jgi:hypothetical protein
VAPGRPTSLPSKNEPAEPKKEFEGGPAARRKPDCRVDDGEVGSFANRGRIAWVMIAVPLALIGGRGGLFLADGTPHRLGLVNTRSIARSLCQ